MGGLGYSQDDEVVKVYQFRRLQSDQDVFEIPEIPENRRKTDRKSLIFFIIVILTLISFLIYSSIYSEPEILNGSDNCGNFCGKKNKKYEEWPCSGQDYTEKKYQMTGPTLEYHPRIRERICVEECPSYSEDLYYSCFSKDNFSAGYKGYQPYVLRPFSALFPNNFRNILADVGRGWWAIILSASFTVVFGYGTLCLFRHAVAFLVWSILVCFAGIFGIASVVFFFIGFSSSSRGGSGGTVLALIFGIIFLVLVGVITCMAKRVKLVIQLFKEAGKATFEIPFLLLIPVWSVIAMSTLFVIFMGMEMYLLFSGELTEILPGYLEYAKNAGMIITLFYNLVVYLWIVEFVKGAQYIVIAGAVSSWFFNRDKIYHNSAVWTAFTNLLRFHLGTLAIGSLIVTIMNIIRVIIKSLTRDNRIRWIVDCCLDSIDELLRFLSKNAYIQTAMHGTPFFKSGKRAASLLFSNACNVIALNSIGDFVLVLAQMLLIVICAFVAYMLAMSTGIKHVEGVAIMSILVSCCIIYMFFVAFEATIDTIFICFCEDTLLNDGVTKPYFMSKGLMQFIEDSKYLMPKKEDEE